MRQSFPHIVGTKEISNNKVINHDVKEQHFIRTSCITLELVKPLVYKQNHWNFQNNLNFPKYLTLKTGQTYIKQSVKLNLLLYFKRCLPVTSKMMCRKHERITILYITAIKLWAVCLLNYLGTSFSPFSF